MTTPENAISFNSLINLNEEFGDMEQRRDDVARKFFEDHLSDQLIFRRANGTVIGKVGPEGFLENLKKPNPFTSRRSEEISVEPLDDRALVNLIVVATRNDNSLALFRNIRLFSRSGGRWLLEFWYNYEITTPHTSAS